MADIAGFRNMFANAIFGLSLESSRELVEVNGVDSMPRLAGMTGERIRDVVNLIRKTTVRGAGRAADRRMIFPEVVVDNFRTAALIAKNYERLDRVLTPAGMILMFADEDLLDMHKAQKLLEEEQDNSLGAAYFEPLTDRSCREIGWKTWWEGALRALEGIRGKTSKTPLAYLARDDIHPLDALTDPETNYATLDLQLIARKPIVKNAHRNALAADCEAAGPVRKRHEAEADNRVLHAYISRALDGTPWKVHYFHTMETKDGRMAVISLKNNLQTQHDLDQKYNSNKARILQLIFHRDTANWNMEKYIAGHKQCHNVQTKLHQQHAYQDFPAKDKVQYFLGGIKDPAYDAVIIQIRADPALSDNFELAQQRVVEFKAILDSRKSSRERRVASIDTHGGRGRGGRGGGAGGGRGRGRGGRGGRGGGRGGGYGRGGGGGGRGGDHYGPPNRSAFRTTHNTTVGGRACEHAKLDDGSWAVTAIFDGGHDDLCALQVHIDKAFYPEVEWKKVEPCERRKVFLNRGTDSQARRGRGGAVPVAVSVASTASASTISSIESSLKIMSQTMKEVIDVNNDNMREISNMKRAVQKANLFENLSDSESSDIMSESSYNNSGGRRRLKANRSSKRHQRDHPALGRQSGSPKRSGR